MADSQTTRIRIDDATQIQLITLLINARSDADAVASVISLLAKSDKLPDELAKLAGHIADSLINLDDRVRVFLEDGDESSEERV